MTEEGKQWLRDEASRIVTAIDDGMTAVSHGYAESVILAASLIIGAREAALADGLGYEREFVDLVGNRLRSAKIWEAETISPEARARWGSEDGGVAFVCDINVARGSFIIAQYVAGEPMYSLSPSGKRDVERLLANPNH